MRVFFERVVRFASRRVAETAGPIVRDSLRQDLSLCGLRVEVYLRGGREDFSFWVVAMPRWVAWRALCCVATRLRKKGATISSQPNRSD